MPLNLEDIARRAGVSRSTVSRVINNEPYVSEKTRAKVLAVVEEVGFAPNPGARMMVTRRTQVIGVVIPQTLTVVFEDPYYFPTLLQGVAEAAQQHDYAMLLFVGNTNEDEQQLYRRILQNRLMDGLVIASATQDTGIIRQLLNRDTPFVMVERPATAEDRVNYVTVDNVGAVHEVVKHLYSLGCRRIGHVTGSLSNADAQDRLAGYRQALRAVGLPVDEDLIVEGHFSSRSGYLAAQTLIARGVDAIFAASDTTALGVMHALQEAGLRVPDDVAVVGFDDLPRALETRPPLTTVYQPIKEKGFKATELLLDMLDNGHDGPQHVVLPTRLVIRESTVKPG
ncbi:MAG: LacI family DNA-binding transcriptional regulator [Anaerolineae bacterium]